MGDDPISGEGLDHSGKRWIETVLQQMQPISGLICFCFSFAQQSLSLSSDHARTVVWRTWDDEEVARRG